MRIVLVEPSSTSAELVSRMLQARQHEVRVFADGYEALACIKSDPDVGAVITAAEPLSISGVELCWEARLAAGSHRPIYLILMSPELDDDQLVVALDHGADEVLGAPPAPGELYARLRAAERLAAMQRDLIRLATTDSLTGMFNRRAFFDKAAELCARAESGVPMSAIMVDIDHFKRINDVHGHDMGDLAICAVANNLMNQDTLVGRLGGEEFAMLRVGCRLADAETLAERLRRELAALDVAAYGVRVALTCSFGVSQWQHGDSIDRLLKRADMALYEAKLAGRNRVVTADPAFRSPTYDSAARSVRSAVRKSA